MNIVICIGISASALIWMGPQPSVGYLARVGPAPLRFQSPPKGLTEIGPLLPPLAMSDPVPPPSENLKTPIETNAPPVVETTVTSTPVPAPQLTPTEPIWTPQMFVQFFNDKNGTNRDFNVVLPYSFMPPPATTIPAQPSRATYVVK